jgi:hypothetical protein
MEVFQPQGHRRSGELEGDLIELRVTPEEGRGVGLDIMKDEVGALSDPLAALGLPRLHVLPPGHLRWRPRALVEGNAGTAPAQARAFAVPLADHDETGFGCLVEIARPRRSSLRDRPPRTSSQGRGP